MYKLFVLLVMEGLFCPGMAVGLSAFTTLAPSHAPLSFPPRPPSVPAAVRRPAAPVVASTRWLYTPQDPRLLSVATKMALCVSGTCGGIWCCTASMHIRKTYGQSISRQLGTSYCLLLLTHVSLCAPGIVPSTPIHVAKTTPQETR
eukprot:Rmarinus@m.27565